MPFTPQQPEYYKQYLLYELYKILSDRDKLIEAIADLEVLKIKNKNEKLTTEQGRKALNKYKPLTYDAIAKDFHINIDSSVSKDALKNVYFLNTDTWSPAERFFIGAALYQASHKTAEEHQKNMGNDKVDPYDVATEDKAPERRAIATHQAIHKYIKEDLWKELDNIEEVRKAFECHQTINSLIELCNEKPLTQEEFEKILFNKVDTDEARKQGRLAARAIMTHEYEKNIDHLLRYIDDNKISNLKALEKERNKLFSSNQTGQSSELKRMGLDNTPIEFNASKANFKTLDGINKLHDQQKNQKLKDLIGAASLSLLNNYYSEDCKKNLVKNFTTLNGATKSIYETCMAIAESPNTNPEQRSAIYTHQDNLTTATLTYATNVIRGPETGNETPAQAAEKNKADYMTNVKASEVTCRSKIDDTVGRKVLSALTNFLSHVTIVGMVANVINKCKTGEWLLFKHKNESRELKKLDKEITDKTYTAPAA